MRYAYFDAFERLRCCIFRDAARCAITPLDYAISPPFLRFDAERCYAFDAEPRMRRYFDTRDAVDAELAAFIALRFSLPPHMRRHAFAADTRCR